jgi:hypothetical protein
VPGGKKEQRINEYGGAGDKKECLLGGNRGLEYPQFSRLLPGQAGHNL